MIDTIARLESLSKGMREMDGDIARAIGEWRDAPVTIESDPYWMIPKYTTSLDAAMLLVPKGSLWSVCRMEDGPFAQVIRPMPGGGFANGLTTAYARTAPIALCAAALKARVA